VEGSPPLPLPGHLLNDMESVAEFIAKHGLGEMIEIMRDFVSREAYGTVSVRFQEGIPELIRKEETLLVNE